MRKILFIAYYFPPIGGGGVQRSISFARHLPGVGYLPMIVTGPGQSDGRFAPHDAGLLEILPSNLKIYRISTPPPSNNLRVLNRLCRWLYLPKPFSKWWIRSAIDISEKVIADDEISLIYATMSPFESAYIASYLSKKYDIPWVADLRDPWALDEMTIYTSFLHRKFELTKMKNLLQNASLIIMNTPEATRLLKKTFGLFYYKNVITITNGFDSDHFSTSVQRIIDHKFRIVHSGSLYSEIGTMYRQRKWFYKISRGSRTNVDILGRSPINLFNALQRWFLQFSGVQDDVRVILIGSISASDKERVEGSTINENVVLKGYLPHNESIQVIRSADLLFLPMHNLPQGERSTTMPGKTYEYMASGRPILAAVPNGDARDILLKCGTAFVCSPDDVEGMINIMNTVYGSWKNKTSTVHPNWEYIYQFERKAQVKRLGKEFEKLI